MTRLPAPKQLFNYLAVVAGFRKTSSDDSHVALDAKEAPAHHTASLLFLPRRELRGTVIASLADAPLKPTGSAPVMRTE